MLSSLVDNTRTDKNNTHSYLDLYQELLSARQQSAKTVLEIGIHRGGSTKLWYDFFPNATIHAIDILHLSQITDDLKNNNRIQLYTSTDAYDEIFFKKTFLDKNVRFDFMLDDGAHTLATQKEFIRLYSQVMTDDGILIIEDVQSMDWIPYLEAAVPENLKKYICVYDLRHLKNQFDDIVFTINKTSTDIKQLPALKKVMTESRQIAISIIILSSFDKLCLECNKITRKQSKQYKIPVLFLFNGRIPEGYKLEPDEFVLETDSTDPKPYMFLKFKYALQNIFNSGSNPDFILRCNSTTFINFKALNTLFFRFPTEKLIAGPFIYAVSLSELDVYCQGTNMVFSNDVAKRIAFDDNANHPAVLEYADDIALDFLTRDYAYKQDISLFTARYTHFTKKPAIYDLYIECTHVFFRVKNNCPERIEIDLEIWKILHFLFDVIHFRNDYVLWGENQYGKMAL
jgi:cephalosporin hydroxylase